MLKQEESLISCYDKNKNSVSKLGLKQLKAHFEKEIKKIRHEKKMLKRDIEIMAGELGGLQERG